MLPNWPRLCPLRLIPEGINSTSQSRAIDQITTAPHADARSQEFRSQGPQPKRPHHNNLSCGWSEAGTICRHIRAVRRQRTGSGRLVMIGSWPTGHIKPKQDSVGVLSLQDGIQFDSIRPVNSVFLLPLSTWSFPFDLPPRHGGPLSTRGDGEVLLL
ncbi:hypothetical protein SODALDRAFT_69737 [Sodiomyces alkalinus F11]|uniref:Uncharacterized protein n=1 Tax=Sodiomyces alkalinus (strain CBS 110278 / VKM F-3762 / F11) TaxID=1314773 RepID=A0A3N2PM17_SODAK|nr:hypothetical protein SODALDRAFT_69737 [Sodiomyces alkalinus F11]ROT35563.1 hypothetical protein SODALDRAFT_69737 [Sodiomyces alkalinus F11]